MSFFLVILIVGCAVAVVTALVRGLGAFFRDAEHIRQHGHSAQEAFGVKQNRMMGQRVFFQGLAVVLIVVLGSVAGQQ